MRSGGNLAQVRFQTQIRQRLIGTCLHKGGGMSLGDLPMSKDDLPYSKARKIDAAADDTIVADALELLSPQLVEQFDDDESPSNEVLRLLEENARLRALAVELSKLVGNLPQDEWGAAMTSMEAIRSIRRRIAT